MNDISEVYSKYHILKELNNTERDKNRNIGSLLCKSSNYGTKSVSSFFSTSSD